MASPRRPDLARKPVEFTPRMLERSIIAMPLLEAIKDENETKQWVRDNHPELLRRYDAAIFFRQGFPDGDNAAWKQVNDFLKEAPKAVRISSMPSIGKPNKSLGQSLSFARLDGALAQWLLRRDGSADVPAIERIFPSQFEIIIDVNLEHPDGRAAAKSWIIKNIPLALKHAGATDRTQGVLQTKTDLSNQYVFARLTGEVIEALTELDAHHGRALAKEHEQAFKKQYPGKPVPSSRPARYCAIHSIWPDFAIRSCINKSIATVKADAAQRAFFATGTGIAWAVMDSGVFADHPHFKLNSNVDKASTWHRDFTDAPTGPESLPRRIWPRHPRRRNHRG